MIIYVEKKNTNCRKLPINYSKIINDHSCIFMIIHVEKKKSRLRHQYFFKKVKKRFDMIRFSKKGCIFVP